MRVLLVAPDVGLDYGDAEVEEIAVSFGRDVVRLRDAVSLGDIQRAVVERYDVLWFVSHGDERGIVLSGEYLDIETIVPMVRRSGARLVVFNSCSSIHIANLVHDECDVAVVATIRDAPDRAAYITGSNFAHWLSVSGDARRAYELAKPGRNRLYVYMNGDSVGMTDDEFLSADERMSALAVTFSKQIQEMDVAIETRLGDLEAAFAQRFMRRWEGVDRRRWLIGFLLFVLFVGILISDIRQLLGIGMYQALSLAVGFAALSGYYLMVGLGFWHR